MSLIAELQRRKVFKVGAAYLVVAWIAIQAASIGFPTFDAPLWVLRVFILVVMLGFPIAVVMAWVFDVTPEGVKLDANTRGSKRVIAAAGLLIVLALGWYFYGQPAFRKGDIATKAASAPTVASVDPRSIAVLPFLNMSDDKGNEYFSDGISEELLNVLVRVNGFNVASRTSSFAYKGREVSAAQIGKELKVKFVLEGSVRKQGDKVRITAQLIDSINDRHLWSETYDRDLKDIFAIQDEIANAIVTAVRTSMGDAATGKLVTVRADTENLNAYDSYLKARELFLARSDMKESIRLFEHAVELDPKFARGWEGLAAVYSVVPSWGITDRDYNTLADKAAHRALELDPKLSMAWAALGNVAQNQAPIDWATSIAMLDRAIAADPHNTTAILWRSIAWMNLGFFDKALADQEHCLALDPHYGICSTWKSLLLLDAGDSDGALALLEQNAAAGYRLHHQPSFVAPLIRRGNRIAAILMLDGLGAKPGLNRILMDTVNHPDAPHPMYADIEKRCLSDPEDPFVKSVRKEQVCLWLNDFDCVGRSTADDSAFLYQWDPTAPRFRNSPGFKRVIVNLGVLKYWQQNSYPPQCHAIGMTDFTCDAPTLKAVK